MYIDIQILKKKLDWILKVNKKDNVRTTKY